MIVIVVAFFSFIVTILAFKQYQLNKFTQQLKWMKSIPGWPFIGNILEIGSLTGMNLIYGNK